MSKRKRVNRAFPVVLCVLLFGVLCSTINPAVALWFIWVSSMLSVLYTLCYAWYD